MARLPTQITLIQLEIQLEFSVALTTPAYERLIIMSEDVKECEIKFADKNNYSLKEDKFRVV